MSLADLVERHVLAGRGGDLALRWRGRDGRRRDLSLDELALLSNRLAGHLRHRGIRPGDVVAVMTGRRPETVIAALAIWKLAAVYCPLFVDLGPDPLLARLTVAKAKLLLVDEVAYPGSILPAREKLDLIGPILVLGETVPPGCDALADMLATDSGPIDPPFSDGAGLLHFTSGTTAPISGGAGVPRAILHDAMIEQRLVFSGREALGLRPGDLLWCTGEPGWALHSTFGIIVPLALGAVTLLDESPPTPTRCLAMLEEEAVDIWYTTPTVIRSLMGAGKAVARTLQRRSLRLAASVGEPLSADAVSWGEQAFGVPFRDSWWQTETGRIILAHGPAHPPCPGSMGRPLADVTVRLAQWEGEVLNFLPDRGEAVGEIVLMIAELAPWRSLGGEQGSPIEDLDGWHLTHDIARRDEAGNYWFVGRADEVINLAGRMIGPFEVEAVLMAHPAVAEVGVVGAPDPDQHQHLVAFIALNPGFDPVRALRDELHDYAIDHLGSLLAPDDIRFEPHLPRTSSGKIIRRRLRAKL